MFWLSRLSVRAKLAMLLGVFAAGIGGLTLASVWGLKEAVHTSQALVRHEVMALRYLGELRADVGNTRRFEKDLFLNLADVKDLQRYHEAWEKQLKKCLETLDRLNGLLTPGEQATRERLQSSLSRYREAVNGIHARIKSGEITDPSGGNKALEPVKGDIRAADEALSDMGKSVEARMDGAVEDLEQTQMRLTWLTLLGAATVLLIALALGWVIGRRISQPLAQAAQAVERVAAGDLSQEVKAEGTDETARMLQGIQRMQGSLAQIVREIRQGVQAMTHASTEIATGNQDLSSRTEQTASNLEETAASMEQLTSTVRNSADAARQANQLAASAAQIASRGGEVVSQVVSTMDEINHSSKKINDIIGVIDGIAFQTNILALNAAVEAARAGEQGRGFAVVAGEVRNLAQRSAQAAKEIKGLIGASVERVEAGSRLVADAGQTMNEIVGSVQRVSDIIGEITAAAGEQSDGIAQVNTAVSQLDQMTQQNAALVEQSAAAAQSLREQAARLAETVQVFRVAAAPHSEAVPPAAPSATLSVRSSPALPANQSLTVQRSVSPAPAPAAPVTAHRTRAVQSSNTEGDWETF